MKIIKIAEAKFTSLFKNIDDDNFYQDGDFVISNDRMKKARDIFYPWYKSHYNEDKNKIIHQLAFAKTMKMIDNGELQALPQNAGDYYSLRNRRFSREQVNAIEKQIYPQFKNMSLEELYDYMLIQQERSHYESNINGKKAIAELLENGFFDEYLNGQLKELALWNLGKVDDVTSMLGKLYSKNRFTGKTNIKTLSDEMIKTHDEIADSDDNFMFNPIYIALDAMSSSIMKLNRIPK